jgi:PrtD family type I secretion system ABC transporter
LFGQKKRILREAFGRLRTALIVVALVSCIVNLLMLTGPVFMLQVYDRVLTSQSVPTLAALMILAIGLYVLFGLFDFLRARILSRAANWLDAAVSPETYRRWLLHSMDDRIPGYKPVSDVGMVRQFLSSPTALALFDLPWFPLFLGIVFLLHFQLGMLAAAGALVVVVLALLNEFLTARTMGEASKADMREARFAEESHANAESIVAMGMLGNTQRSWGELRDEALHKGQRGSERAQYFMAMSKAFRLLLQSAILGWGAYLAILQEISPGTIVAASIIAGRALAPLDQTINGWRTIKKARIAYKRLQNFLTQDSVTEAQSLELPAPRGLLAVNGATKRSPDAHRMPDQPAILSNISFELQPGDGLGVIGPSASGKSSLAKLLIGIWLPDTGSVRLDGATFDQWDQDLLGPHLGYLPQEVELLPGTIGQNISRFEENPSDEEVVKAATITDVHEMILSFPHGYDTYVDAAVSPLTGGQKQRIALARAIYRLPKLVVLDEPNSNLDVQGDAALANAIRVLREAGSTVVVMAHRPSAIAAVDKILMLHKGQATEFGPKEDVLRKVTRVA